MCLVLISVIQRTQVPRIGKFRLWVPPKFECGKRQKYIDWGERSVDLFFFKKKTDRYIYTDPVLFKGCSTSLSRRWGGNKLKVYRFSRYEKRVWESEMRFKILHPFGEQTFICDTHFCNIRVGTMSYRDIVLGQDKAMVCSSSLETLKSIWNLEVLMELWECISRWNNSQPSWAKIRACIPRDEIEQKFILKRRYSSMRIRGSVRPKATNLIEKV